MKNSPSRRRRAFTLVEIMVAIGISSVVMGVAYRFLAFGARSAGRSGQRSGNVDATSSGLLQLIRRVRYAEQLLEPGHGETSETLEYRNTTTGGWTVSAQEDGLVLEEKHGTTRKVLAPGVRKVEFTRDNHLMKVTFHFGEAESGTSYSTLLYTRGAWRPPGT